MESLPTFVLGDKYQWRRGDTQNIADIKKKKKGRLCDKNVFRRIWKFYN